MSSVFGFENKPMLTEPGIRYFIGEMLKQCHKYKEQYYNNVFNIMLFISFFVILGILLLYKYKGKLTPEEIAENDKLKKQYILSKIKLYKEEKIRTQQSLITGLPHWDDEYDNV
jgi:hypothetical protein